MTVELFYNSSEMNKVDKELTPVLSLTGSLRDSTSITSPVIIFAYDGELPPFNYMYIPEFNRYYFVGEIDSIRTGLWSLNARVDVLMSFKTEIRNNTAVVRRQENNYNLYLDDGVFKTYQNPHIKVKYLPNGFNTANFVLAVAGGEGNV